MVTSRFTLGAALVVLVQLIAPTGAAAQASREGPSFAASGGWGTVRLPDVAYDAYHGVYLTVSGNNTVGRFVGMNGDPLGGQFCVSTLADAQPERARRLQSRPAAHSWWCGTTPASIPTSTRCGGASSATPAAARRSS